MDISLTGLTITPEILRLIAEIDEFKGSWRALGALNPERLRSLRHVAAIESIGSSTRIEGAKLSDAQVEALLSGLRAGSFASRDEEEVAGYAEAMETIFESFADIPFTENHIKQLHAMLLRHSGKDERHRGEYKKFSNHVEAFDEQGRSLGVIFETTSPFDTPREMNALVVWTRETLEDRSHHPLIVAAVFTVSFLAIHPFQDGNGRLSRILTSLLLLQAGYGYIPYASLESVVEKNKDAYYLALRRTQTTLKTSAPDWSPWLLFFLRALKRQKDHLQVKVERLSALPAMGEGMLRILERAGEVGRITTKEAEALTGAPRPTVKAWLAKLTEQGRLRRHGEGRGSFYVRGGE